MPVRPRRARRSRYELTLARDVMLSLGPHPGRPRPKPGDDEWEALRACWWEHRSRYSDTAWGFLAFDPAGDVEAALAANPLEPVD